jgi:predicted ATPase with chaperone activity
MSTAAIEVPETVEDLGIPRNLLEDLALKTLYLHGEMSLRELADGMHVSYAVVEDLFRRLRKELLCEVKGLVNLSYQIAITTRGREHALELLSLNHYAGPAPVSLVEYVTRVRAQSVREAEVRPEDAARALSHLVLTKETVIQVGTAVTSGMTVFLYGPSGTGKTSIAEAIPGIYQDPVWIPHAVEVDAQIIVVYDSRVHARTDEQVPGSSDARWVRCRRPCVVVGGELTLEMLDLQFNATANFYSAPLQMKANNGVLIIDDFGRQRIRPQELLNRWMMPLDRGIDFLTLAGGMKFEVPFDLLLAFATNLDPTSLADEAFLRRIPSKVKVDNCTPEQFHEIFRRVCEKHKLTYDASVVDEMLGLLGGLKQQLRPCYPRDIVRQICWAASYGGTEPHFDLTAVTQACRNYFLWA